MNCEKTEFGLPRMPVEENSEPSFSSLESLRKAIEGIREIPGTEGFYNAAAWKVDEKTYLLGRNGVTGGEGKPDVGSLVLKILGSDGNIVSSKEVWQPRVGEDLLEDARALLLLDGRIAFGLTSVAHEGEDYIPYPAVLITSTEELMEKMLPKPKVIKAMGRIAITSLEELMEGMLPEPEVIEVMGKGGQTTPLDEDISISAGKNVTALSPDLFAFRSEGDNNNHRLKVFGYQQEDGKVTFKQSLDFSENKPPWGEYRIGTTMPPVWLNKDEAFLPIHGINLVDSKYVYSIGTARLLRDENGILSVDNISQEPIIDPDLFVGMFNSDEIELHSERRVVYCCGGIPFYNDSGEFEHLKLYVNVGDKRTVEVTVSVDKLIKGWQRNGV